MVRRKGKSKLQGRKAFTLIELLVVVSIIALLIAILLPSLTAARAEAQAVVCATNLHHVGQAAALYLTRDKVYPVSYAYLDEEGKIDLDPSKQFQNMYKYGYVHWSYFLYESGKVSEKAFQCPAFDSGGVPRTNPGPNGADWEPNQVDMKGQSDPNPRVDLQAPRVAYTANAAIMPRNKFDRLLSKGNRINRLTNDSAVRRASGVIMATEFNNNWKSIAVQDGGGLLSKSHRPVSPFYHWNAGWDEYQPKTSGKENDLYYIGDPHDSNRMYGLMPYASVRSTQGMIDDSEVNCIGRHHPGGDKEYGGTTNFLYVDSHVERKTIFESMRKNEWGERYYSLEGSPVIHRPPYAE